MDIEEQWMRAINETIRGVVRYEDLPGVFQTTWSHAKQNDS